MFFMIVSTIMQTNRTTPDGLDQWKDSCSICFESKCEFSLPHCQDQFCKSCMGKYLAELISNAWGYTIPEIRCPVCYDVLSKEVWSRYADHKTITLYDERSRPYRVFSRFCPTCGDEIKVCQPPVSSSHDKMALLKSVRLNVLNIFYDDPTFFQYFEVATQKVIDKSYSETELYHLFLDRFLELRATWGPLKTKRYRRRQRLAEESCYFLASQTSRLLIEIETVPEKWKELQFIHMSQFTNCLCLSCNQKLCLQCGEPVWHSPVSCEEYLRQELKEATKIIGDDALNVYANIEWKLNNTRRCPKCTVFINRDEGCHKVECVVCGFKFCWICRQKWSKDCGYFRCGNVNAPIVDEVTQEAVLREKEDKDKPELGVPNVTNIQLRAKRLSESSVRSVDRESDEDVLAVSDVDDSNVADGSEDDEIVSLGQVFEDDTFPIRRSTI